VHPKLTYKNEAGQTAACRRAVLQMGDGDICTLVENDRRAVFRIDYDDCIITGRETIDADLVRVTRRACLWRHKEVWRFACDALKAYTWDPCGFKEEPDSPP
jgi:hypothetical protein